MTKTAERDARPVSPRDSLLTPLGIREVTLAENGFWGIKNRVNASATLAHCLYWQERSGWIANFDGAARGTLPETRRGREFADSEIYKLLEAMAWEYGASGDASIDGQFRAVVARVAAAQEPDGYLNTNFGRPGQAPRYSDLAWGHELYNYGHLLQAAVARVRATGTDELFDIATRVADHICDTFGEHGLHAVCGHPEVELGLVEFGRLTGNQRYIDQAAIFIDRRGEGTLPDIEFGRAYYQDDVPIRDADVLRGHAVRALYLSAAAVDVADQLDDAGLMAAIERQWERTVARRTYLTGGMGSHHQDEAFGDDFELPSDRAYCETCASVASIMLAWRLLLATGEAKYADLIERTLFNVVATSPAPDGRSFFYANTLHQRTPGVVTNHEERSPRASSTMRAPWFDVSCCPGNVARTLASVQAYLATVTADGLQLHQYAAGQISTALADGREVGLEVETTYPHDGDILLRITHTPSTPWSLSLRVPAWAVGATLSINGATENVPTGYVRVDRAFEVGDEIRLLLPVAPRFTRPNERIDAIRGTLAVEAGPLVHCLESVDLPDGVSIDDFIVENGSPEYRDGRVFVRGWHRPAISQPWPYDGAHRSDDTDATAVDVALVPYYLWATRGPSAMRVWIRSS